MIKPHRTHSLAIAHLLHRFSGLGLVLFLPCHFYLLSLALTDPEMLDSAFQFTENPLIKVAEFGLVFLLAVHFFGGLRLLALEWLPWSDSQKTMAAGAVAISLFISGLFFLRAF